MKKLTPLQKQVYEYIIEYKQKHDGCTPPEPTIAQVCNCNASTMRYTITALERKGLLYKIGRRSIMVAGSKWIPPKKKE